VNGTIQDVVDEMRADGRSIGSLSITCFRPFPHVALRAALMGAQRIIVIEKSLAPGSGGMLAADVQMSLPGGNLFTVIAGLGGRAITKASLRQCFEDAMAGCLAPLTFLDLNTESILRRLEREDPGQRSGSAAQSLARDINFIAARIG
jgi:pyruvate ferredoxin oxidoreductase alpha subunit